MEIISHSAQETFEIGRHLGEIISRDSIIAFSGDIGSGKTTMIKGIASILGIPPDEIISPYFNILFEYSKGSKIVLYHFDFMRLSSINELYELNFREIIEGEGLVVIEWAGKFEAAIPESAIKINIQDTTETERIITINCDDVLIQKLIVYLSKDKQNFI